MKDGGPAFPYEERTGDGLPHADHFGMSLRDYFAAKAMQALIASLGDEKHRAQMLKEGHSMADIPRVAFGMSDAMLEARGKQ